MRQNYRERTTLGRQSLAGLSCRTLHTKRGIELTDRILIYDQAHPRAILWMDAGRYNGRRLPEPPRRPSRAAICLRSADARKP